MPAWKDKLSDNDIEAVIAWIQARWPEDVYKSWVLMDEKALARASTALRLYERPGGRGFSLPLRPRRCKIPASLTCA